MPIGEPPWPKAGAKPALGQIAQVELCVEKPDATEASGENPALRVD